MKICNLSNGKYILVYKNYAFKCSSHKKKFYNAIGFSHDLHIIYNFMKPL